MNANKFRRLLTALPLGLTALPALADSLSITFAAAASPNVSGVPLSPAMAGCLAVGLGGLAYLALRKQRGRGLMSVAAAGVTLAAALSLSPSGEASAVVSATPLTTSPYNLTLPPCLPTVTYSFTSGSGSILINSVTEVATAPGFPYYVIGTDTCTGATLDASSTCTVVLNQPNLGTSSSDSATSGSGSARSTGIAPRC